MFKKTARLYDAMYSWKDYAAETAKLREIISQHQQSNGNRLLDIACGTGQHLCLLQADFSVEGLDLDQELLEVAAERCPDVPLHHADMVDFALDHLFDVIVCLFSSIGYVKTLERMRQAVQMMANHLRPGAVLIIEPWFAPGQFMPDTLHALFIDQPDLKISRMNISRVENGVSILDFHYLVGTPEGIDYFTEHHELGLFTVEEYTSAFQAAGLAATYDPDGLTGRGLHIGVKPLA